MSRDLDAIADSEVRSRNVELTHCWPGKRGHRCACDGRVAVNRELRCGVQALRDNEVGEAVTVDVGGQSAQRVRVRNVETGSHERVANQSVVPPRSGIVGEYSVR